MNSVAPPEFEEQTLVQHLLGLLPETEQERLDTLSISDDTVAARLRDAENDLVDSYVRGELSGERLDRFLTHYLTGERRRRKVLFAESLLKLEKARNDVAPLGAPRRAAAPDEPRPGTRWMAWAAAIVLSVAAGTAAFDDLRLRRNLSQSTAALSSLETQMRINSADLSARDAQSHELQAEVSRLKGMVADLQSASGAVAKVKPLLDRVVSFLLSAPTRGVEALPVLTLPPDAGQVAVTLQLDDPEFGRYRVSLESRAGQTVLWQSPTLSPETGKHGAALKINVPAERVKSGVYRFDVVGLDQGHEVAVASYAFNVNREE